MALIGRRPCPSTLTHLGAGQLVASTWWPFVGMTSNDRNLTCKRHGRSPATFTCQHLAAPFMGRALGFNTARTGPRPDAWCDDCDARARRSGGWRGEAAKLLGVTCLCGGCYDDLRGRHARG